MALRSVTRKPEGEDTRQEGPGTVVSLPCPGACWELAAVRGGATALCHTGTPVGCQHVQ